MKINNFTLILLFGLVLSGLMIAGYLPVKDKEEISGPKSQNQLHASETHAAASIPTGTILVLLAVGIIGFLGVSRKKSNGVGPAPRNAIHGSSNNQNLNAGEQKPIAKNV